MKKSTLGDDQELACPACGHEHCFSDWLYDGWTGGETTCDNADCSATFDVGIDWHVTLRAVLRAEKED